jgi:hypothetical protein
MIDGIIIVGNGETTRANVEALIDDYIYANPEVVIYITVESAISEGQIWAAQYAVDKEVKVIAYMTEGAKLTGLPLEVTRQNSNNPVQEACKINEEIVAFMLWEDEDVECLNAMAELQSNDVDVLDLTNGLVKISSENPIKKVEKPKIPEQELLPEPEPEVETSDEGDEYEDPLYEAIRTVAEIFAEELAKKLAEVLDK